MVASAVRRLAVLLAALGLAAASCGGDPPSPPPFTPSTVASSPTPTGPVEPVLPEAAKQPTEEGARAFAVFYWDVATYAQATGDTKGLRALGAVTCQPCEAGVEGVEQVYARGGVVRGGSYAPSVVDAHDASSNVKAYSVTVRLKISAQVIDYPGTRKDVRTGANQGVARMRLNFLDSAWVVAFLESA